MNKKEEQKVDGIVHIDKTRLDDEAENQPYLVWQYGRYTAKAVQALDEAAADLKLAEADVDEAIRSNPEDYGVEPSTRTGKPTEPSIKSAILRSKEYNDAIKEFNQAKYRLNMLEAANKALDHKRTSITTLDGQDERGYFARPKQKQRGDVGDEFGHRKKMRDKRRKG